MARRASASTVKVWEEVVVIPTYPTPPPDLNPMFLEKRVYQGSSGKVYPNPFTDRVSSEKVDRKYRAVSLENDYLKIMILPEIGGRIHRGLDKTNQYDFFYYQHVIKPALVGLLGPWISGGVEFNWPQHHRPSTFMPADYSIEKHADGSATVWLSEHEPMNRMKGMVGIRLYPDKALVEACVQIYNRTPFRQTFLWWANAGIPVHDQYQAFFPPDVTYVADHAKRAVTDFPIAHDFYYGVDYSRGGDLRWYRNIPVPMSYMVTDSKYDFFGGYDHRKQAGFVHVANRHIAPGKKLWSWGNGEFGIAWDRELTDSDGPYIELMAGAYTDNQPDFSWLHPFETRTFRQCWYPIQQIGVAKNANRQAAISLEIESQIATFGISANEQHRNAKLILQAGNKVLFKKTVSLAPGLPVVENVELPKGVGEPDLLLFAWTSDGRELIQYRGETVQKISPEPAKEPLLPEKIATTDELYVVGLHLEQYRHATRRPEPYWEEALRRDPGDARNNNALGLLQLRRGSFDKAEGYFRRAIKRLTAKNPNPYDGEPYYNLGQTLKFQGRFAEAYAAFAKAAWNAPWQSASHYALAEIETSRGSHDLALEHLEKSLDSNRRNSKARNLKAAILRQLGRTDESLEIALEAAALDRLDFWARYEIILARRANKDGSAKNLLGELTALMQGQVQTSLDIAFDYAGAGLYADAIEFLKRVSGKSTYPMLFYALGFFHQQKLDLKRALELYGHAAQAPSDYCFPSQLEEMIILQTALRAKPKDAMACYYLGNLLYDKKRYEEAIKNWEKSIKLNPNFSIAWRNLGIAYYNVSHDPEKATTCYRRAFEANPNDARLLYEMDQLAKRLGKPPKQRLSRLEKHPALVEQRDDLTIELVTLYNQTGKSKKALAILQARRFHPWEGGEGMVSSQYIRAHLILGREALQRGRAEEALTHFVAAQHYPANLGEGKHLLTPENNVIHFVGLAHKALGATKEASQAFEQAAKVGPTLSPMTFYRALALKELGQKEHSVRLLLELLEAAALQANMEVKVDYFATSLPNFLLFEDDLQKRNEIDSDFLVGLAHLGLGNLEQAEKYFQAVLKLDVNHLEAQEQMRWLHLGTSFIQIP
ncbi:MAG: DUF5107 domain-containing protein [Acidobacteriota bacterium]|nr:DUF5107 domain-containing protein [Acidobacteriota bacterium]